MSTTSVRPGMVMMFSPFYEMHQCQYEVQIVSLVRGGIDGVAIELFEAKIIKSIARNPTGRPRHHIRERVLVRVDELTPLLRTISEVEDYLAT